MLSFFCENLPISVSSIWRWESRASGTPLSFHQVNKGVDFYSAMLAKPQACFLIPVLCDKELGVGGKEENFEGLALAVIEGITSKVFPRGVKGEVLLRQTV